MDVLFLSPAYPPEMMAFTRGLAEVGAAVWGVGDTPRAQLSPELRRHLADYLHVPSTLATEDVMARVHEWLGNRVPDRIESNWEPVTELAAALRARYGVPGLSIDTVLGFRDKVVMRERVAAAGLRVPRTVRAATETEAREAVEFVGFPLIIKPVAGAGSADTWRCNDFAELDRALAATRHVAEVSVEEFIVGDEYTYETICIDGRPVHESSTRYLPNVLDARRHQWISPIIMGIRDMNAPAIRAGVELGRAVLKALGMGTGFTHMEWYRTPKGEAVFGEVACRSPGALMVDVMCAAADHDLYREWARAVCWSDFRGPTERPYNSAVVFKRARGEGRIRAIHGVEGYRRRFGPWIVREDLLPVGAPRRDWQQTFLSDGHVLVRHPDWAATLEMAVAATTDIQLDAG